MASVLDFIECPNCSTEAQNDYYFKTGEEYTHCNNCGYYYSATIINRDKKLDELTVNDWRFEEIKNPYGSYRLKFKDHVSTQCGTLRTEQDFNDLKNSVDEVVENGTEVEFFGISRLIGTEIIVETYIDTLAPYNHLFSSEEMSDDLPF